LKPDVCRRMVGRLPSPPLERDGMAAAWFNTKQPSCEIRSDSNPSHSSHDWHVQPSLSKTESHSRLSGRPSVQDGSESVRCLRNARSSNQIRLSSKPVHLTVRATKVSTHCAHRISTSFQPLPDQPIPLGDSAIRENPPGETRLASKGSVLSAQQNSIFRLSDDYHRQIGSRRHGRSLFMKDPLEVLAKSA